MVHESRALTRKAVLSSLAVGLSGGATLRTSTAHAATATPGERLNVREAGAAGDGVTDDTAAVRAALTQADGATVYFPPGRYALNGLVVDGVANLQLDDAAVLLHKSGTTNASMVYFRGTSLKVSGGSLDGNKENQTGRPYLISGRIESGKLVHLDGVSIRNSVAAVVYAASFGGALSVERCHFSGQAEHDGVAGHFTCILMTVSGQEGGHGLVRFNHNTCVGTESPAIAGANPGGLFIANNGFIPGSPGSEGFAHGNLSTLEVVGNYFWGYGQNAAGNDISPIHTYPAVNGARVVGNYFERCGFCAISAKSVQNFVCVDNIVVNGLTTAQNVASEGAISYMPGYQAASQARPRAVIAGNIIDSPGGQPTERQSGISVHGLAASHARQVVISDNVMSGCGRGIKVNYVDDIIISGNVIDSPAGTSVYTKDEDGVRVDNAFGHVQITGNRIVTRHGHGIYALSGVSSARFSVKQNVFEHSSPTHYGTTIRGCEYVHLEGNTYHATSGTAVYLTAYGTTKLKHLHLGSNSFAQGAAVMDFANIEKATGSLHGTLDPRGRVIPGEVGTIYRRSNGKGPDAVWVSTGTTSSEWAPLLTAGVDACTPTVRVGAGAGTDATAQVTGNDSEGVLQVLTGSAPPSDSGVASVVFETVRAQAPRLVVLTPANDAAARQSSTVYVPQATLAKSGFGVSVAASALRPATTYQWYYRAF